LAVDHPHGDVVAEGTEAFPRDSVDHVADRALLVEGREEDDNLAPQAIALTRGTLREGRSL